MLMPVIMQTDLQKSAYKGQSCQRIAITISAFEQCLTKLFQRLNIILNIMTVNKPELPIIFEATGKSSGEAAKH